MGRLRRRLCDCFLVSLFYAWAFASCKLLEGERAGIYVLVLAVPLVGCASACVIVFLCRCFMGVFKLLEGERAQIYVPTTFWESLVEKRSFWKSSYSLFVKASWKTFQINLRVVFVTCSGKKSRFHMVDNLQKKLPLGHSSPFLVNPLLSLYSSIEIFNYFLLTPY